MAFDVGLFMASQIDQFFERLVATGYGTVVKILGGMPMLFLFVGVDCRQVVEGGVAIGFTADVIFVLKFMSKLILMSV